MKNKIIISLVAVSIIVVVFLFYNNVGLFYSLIRPSPTVRTILIGESIEDNTATYRAEAFFPSKDRKLIFNYTIEKTDEVFFTLENGNNLMLHNRTGVKKIMELHKLAPYTVENGIKAIAENNGLLAKECTIKKTQENYWIISSSEENQIDCGEYSQAFDDSETKYFTIISDYYLAFIDKPNNIFSIEEIKIYFLE